MREGTLMTRAIVLPILAIVLIGLPGSWTAARAADKADFALFDGTNPDNSDPGAICAAKSHKKKKAKNYKIKKNKSFTYHVTATNFSQTDGEIRVIYLDGRFVRYIVPAGQSFNLSQAGGSRGGEDAAIRVDSDPDIAGAVSAKGRHVSCVSCDEDAAGDVGCDDIIPN